MHVDLVELLARQVILLTRRAHVGLSEHVELGVVADEGPDADVELALAEEQGSLDVLLHDERAVLNFFHAFLSGLALFKLVLRDLAGQFLDLFISSLFRSLLLTFGRGRRL